MSQNSEIPYLLQNDYEVIVTTGDLKYLYDVISPVYFRATNQGIGFINPLNKLKKKYSDEIVTMKKNGLMSRNILGLEFLLYGDSSLGHDEMEAAFFVAMRELQNRAFRLRCDAIVSMHQNIDFHPINQFYQIQMYGTAVRFKR